MLIVGVSGHLRCGKDVIASFLTKHYGFERHAFADTLKDEVEARFPRTLAAYLRRAFPDGSVDARRLVRVVKDEFARSLLQEYGTGVRRQDDPDYWVTTWAKKLMVIAPSRVVAPDVRFPNEAERIRHFGGYVVKVERPGQNPGAVITHASEDFARTFTDWDHVFVNDGTIADIERKVGEWMETILA